MANAEFLDGLWYGKPGGVIDETYSEEFGDHLYFTYHNEKGQIICYVSFPRDYSPKEISDLLYHCADLLEIQSPENLSPEEISERARIFREQAAKVPGIASD